MTRTPDRRRPVILLSAVAAVLALLCGACTNGETVSTAAPSRTGSTVVVSTTERTTSTTTSIRSTATTMPTTTAPAELARRAVGATTSTAPFSPYAELENQQQDDPDVAASANDAAGTRENAGPESSTDAPGEGVDRRGETLAVAEASDSIGGQDAADEETPSTSTSSRVPTTVPITAPATTAKTTTATAPVPSYVVTAVPATVAPTTAGRSVTPSTSLAERTVRTTPPIFLPSPDRSSPTVRRTPSTTTRRTTTTSRPRTTTTTTTAPPTTTTTTTAPPTTTTTAKPTIYSGSLGALDPNAPATGRAGHLPPALPASLAPLTGLPVTATNARGAIVVKVDNAGPARPQSGLDIADIVYEERVEGSATRFAAVFHSTGGGSVGPIRSARSTDLGILGSFSRPAFVFSGANEEFRRLVAGQRIVDLGADVWGGYWRSTNKRAPYNLYAKLSTVWNKAPGVAPRPHFAYRAPGSASSTTAAPASAISVAFDGNKISYAWHASSGTWRRSQNGRAHNAASGARIAPENVIVQDVAHVATGLTDVTGFPVVEARLVGSGSALVFTDGKVIRARWSKPSLASITTFVDTAGKAILLTPGRTWVELADPGSTTWSS